MGHSEHKQHLITLARRRAFETYLRFGRKPNTDAPSAERKAINPATPLPGALPQHATRFYVWRTQEDDRVRHSHAERHGQIFARTDPPRGGHPGTEPGCRCWAEPYYGDPSIPDALQPLNHLQQVNTDPATPWASIETLTRPDGSLARSVVALNDGTVIKGQFQATSILRVVTLADGTQIRVDTESGLQSIYLGADSVPLFQSRWTDKGPKVVRARQHVAFQLDDSLLDLRPAADPLDGISSPLNGIIDPNPMSTLLAPGDGIGLGLVGLGLLAVYAAQQTAPASQGLGEDDVPYLALRAWVASQETGLLAVMADAITQERIRKFCTLLPDAQSWTDEAAAALAAGKPILSATGYGKALHLLVKNEFDTRRALLAAIYADSYAEYSIDASGTRVQYGASGSSRLDLIQLIPVEQPRVICVIEIKTGGATVQNWQRDAYMKRLLEKYPNALVLMMQVKPSVHPF